MIDHLIEIFEKKNSQFINGDFHPYLPLGLFVIHYNSIYELNYQSNLISSDLNEPFSRSNLELTRKISMHQNFQKSYELVKWAVSEGMFLFDDNHMPINKEHVHDKFMAIDTGSINQYESLFEHRISLEALLDLLPHPTSDYSIRLINKLYKKMVNKNYSSKFFQKYNSIQHLIGSYNMAVRLGVEFDNPNKKNNTLITGKLLRKEIAGLIWSMVDAKIEVNYKVVWEKLIELKKYERIHTDPKFQRLHALINKIDEKELSYKNKNGNVTKISKNTFGNSTFAKCKTDFPQKHFNYFK